MANNKNIKPFMMELDGDNSNPLGFLNLKELDEKIKNQLKDFSSLLDVLSSVEEKTKSLWKQIYENAVEDRKNAFIMWFNLYSHVNGNPTEHAIHGQNLSKYLERMSKANDQMIKLAQLVAESSDRTQEQSVSQEDMYSNILKMQGQKQ